MHGVDATQAAIDASAALFGNGDLGALDAADPAVARSPSCRVGHRSTPGDDLAHALVETELVKSLGEARRAIDQGGVYVNNARADDPAHRVADLALPGGVLVLRRGKKTLAGVTLACRDRLHARSPVLPAGPGFVVFRRACCTMRHARDRGLAWRSGRSAAYCFLSSPQRCGGAAGAKAQSTSALKRDHPPLEFGSGLAPDRLRRLG